MACAPPPPDPLILLISLDTTRADALSCYGAPDARTPAADALAQRGVRFEMALAQSPTTLASHTAMMSGVDTHGHGVVRNGFPVPADLPLLAERLGAAGWDRAAVVASFALESDMGLDRGFRDYEDHGWLGWFGEYAVDADTVTAHALDQLDDRQSGAPMFLFAHYYDAHRPWTRAPDALRAQFIDADYSGPGSATPAGMQAFTDAATRGTLTEADLRHARGLYLAEVASADAAIADLIDGLAERDMADDTLIVLTADHGEVLHEIPERPYRHGPDVDVWATQVPLIISGTGRFETPRGHTVARQVRVQDIPSTLLAAAGIAETMGDGEDLAPLWGPTPPTTPAPPSFAEGTRPHEALRTAGWPNADLERGVAVDGHIYTHAPHRPDGDAALRTLAAPTQPVHDPTRAAQMRTLLDAWDAVAPGHRTVTLDSTTEDALKALGYIE